MKQFALIAVKFSRKAGVGIVECSVQSLTVSSVTDWDCFSDLWDETPGTILEIR